MEYYLNQKIIFDFDSYAKHYIGFALIGNYCYDFGNGFETVIKNPISDEEDKDYRKIGHAATIAALTYPVLVGSGEDAYIIKKISELMKEYKKMDVYDIIFKSKISKESRIFGNNNRSHVNTENGYVALIDYGLVPVDIDAVMDYIFLDSYEDESLTVKKNEDGTYEFDSSEKNFYFRDKELLFIHSANNIKASVNRKNYVNFLMGDIKVNFSGLEG